MQYYNVLKYIKTYCCNKLKHINTLKVTYFCNGLTATGTICSRIYVCSFVYPSACPSVPQRALESHLSFHLFFFACNKVILNEGVPISPLDGPLVGPIVGNQLFLPAYLERHMPYIQPCLLSFVLKEIE